MKIRTAHWLGAGCAMLLVTATLTSYAQDGKAHKARILVDAMGGNQTGEQVLVLLQEQIKSSPGVPPGFLETMKNVANPEVLTDQLARLYTKELDLETIEAAIAFYETPAGKKLAAAQPALTLGGQRAIQAWSQQTVQAAMKAQGLGDPAENMKEARRVGNEAAAVGALKTLSISQSLFREADKDKNDRLDYAGSIEALGEANLIDSVLASGTKQGYRFELCHSTPTPEFLWMAVASPVEPGVTGDRYFVINHQGVTFYSKDKPFTLDRTECKIPEGATPVGR